MSITTPGMFGLILRKNDRTALFIEEQIAHLRRHCPQIAEEDFNQDEDLIGFSVAMNGYDLRKTIEGLESSGAIRDVDFVATSSAEGVIGPLPTWLSSSLAPTGNPPELEASMTPEVRAMWEDSRAKLYQLARTPGEKTDA